MGRTPTSIASIESFAHEHKLTVKEKSPARRTVILSGTVAAMNQAFGVELKEYQHPNGRYRGRTGAVHIPTELQDVIEGVFGLDNRPQAKPHFRRRHGQSRRPRPEPSASPTRRTQVAAFYDYPTGVDGTGECIALIELGGGYNSTDLSSYWSQLNLSKTPTVSAVSVGNGSNNPTGDPNGPDGEVMLDIEVSRSDRAGRQDRRLFCRQHRRRLSERDHNRSARQHQQPICGLHQLGRSGILLDAAGHDLHG